MTNKIMIPGIFIVLTLLLTSCGTETTLTNTPLPPPLVPTNTPLPPIAAPTSTPFWGGPCDPSTEQIEVNRRLTKGVGVGYTLPEKTCSVFCIHVPEGSQLLIGIADLDYQLNFTVEHILFPNWDPGLVPHRGVLVGNKRIIVNPRNEIMKPFGSYYVYVCLDEGSGEFWRDEKLITFPDATTFTLYNEFTK